MKSLLVMKLYFLFVHYILVSANVFNFGKRFVIVKMHFVSHLFLLTFLQMSSIPGFDSAFEAKKIPEDSESIVLLYRAITVSLVQKQSRYVCSADVKV